MLNYLFIIYHLIQLRDQRKKKTVNVFTRDYQCWSHRSVLMELVLKSIFILKFRENLSVGRVSFFLFSTEKVLNIEKWQMFLWDFRIFQDMLTFFPTAADTLTNAGCWQLFPERLQFRCSRLHR